MRSLLTLCGPIALLVAVPAAPLHAQDEATAEGSAEAAAKEEQSKEPADPSGAWRWQRDFNGQTMDFELKLNWDGKKLTGDYTSFGQTSKIEEAKLDKDRVTFEVPREFNGNEFYVDFDGRVKDDEIVGTIGVDVGDGQEFEWLAKRSVTIDDVIGEWELVIDTPRGEFESTVDFQKEGDGIKATLTNDFGTFDAEEADVKDNQAVFHLSGGQGDQTFDFVYKLKPRGDKLTGVTEFDFGGRTGEWTFEGKRVPAEEQAAPGAADDGQLEAEGEPDDEGPTRERPPLESADE